jgi:hypothetical protein
MSCPRWDRLVAFRYEGPAAQEPAGWQEALEHLDSCPACRDAALTADPSLAFRHLPEVTLGADELEGLRSGVDALRRADRIEASALGSRTETGGRSHRPSRRLGRELHAIAPAAGRLAAAALLAGTLLSALPDGLADGRAVAPSTPQALQLQADAATAGPVLAGDDIESPTASVYYLDDHEIAITMVVDPDLDV